MKADLSPKYYKIFGDLVLLWFKVSNSYILIHDNIYRILEIFFLSKDVTGFIDECHSLGYTKKECEALYTDILNLLENQNTTAEVAYATDYDNIDVNTISFEHRNSYCISNIIMEIKYSSLKVKHLIHPYIEHLGFADNTEHTQRISIINSNNKLFLVQNDQIVYCCEQKDYHLLQGKFSLLLLNLIHASKESDYIASFHASTVAKHNKALMLVGLSGSGKSTLSALLMANGFNLVADDISYMTKSELEISAYPAAISIKEGSIKTLENYFPNLKNLPVYILDKRKGGLRFLSNGKILTKSSYPCEAIILVNYQKDADTSLETITVKEILEVLIPDSWISPEDECAQKFLDWLSNTKFFKLTYSNSGEAINCLNAYID